MPTAPVSLMPALRRVIAGRAAERGDDDLLTAFVADRDPEAFAALVRRHGPMVLGVCRRVVRDYDAADDAFQAVFLVLARRAADVRPRNRVGAWLYGVAYRTALKARAARARRRTRESQVDAMPEPAAPPAADGWDELKPVLDEELARLPDRLRVPVVLCDLEGRPQRAVAGQLGIAPATLAGRLADARKALAARLTRRGVTLSAAALAALLAEKASAGVVTPQLAAGVVRAAEAVAAGGAAAGLVSANALQLCDGVMRMIFLTKLKAAAATAAVLLAVAGAVGPGLKPATAGEEPAAPAPATARLADDDAAYLDQVCLMFRNSKATAVEHGYFAADADAGKRKKVARWLIDGPTAAATLTSDVRDVTYVFGTEPNLTAVDAAAALAEIDGTASALEVFNLPARVQTGGEPRWADLARLVETQKKAEPGKRVDVVVQAEKDAKPAAPGEPVRVKVVVATDDGKGGVNYKVEERLAVPAKAAGPKTTAVPGYKVELVTPPGKDGPPQALLRWVGDGSKPAGNQTIPDVRLWQALPPGKGEEPRFTATWGTTTDGIEPDAAFLRRAVTEARGTPPTALEERYFAADRDPRKREKLLDALLADPAALRRVGEGWKRRMLTPSAAAPQLAPATPKTTEKRTDLKVVPLPGLPYLSTEPKGATLLRELYVAPLPNGQVPPLPTVQPKTTVRGLLLDEKGNVTQPRIEVRDLPVTPKGDVVKPKAATPPAPPAPPMTKTVPAPKAVPPVPAAPAVRTTASRVVSDKWGRLVGELIAAGKTDEQMLESLSLAAAGRLPTEVERRLSLAVLPTAADRAAGWTAVARALAGPPSPPAPPPVPPSPR
ncbi:MAG: sigma-70 family RNA polymerase sigma factor [Gemmataceae bacterium]